MDTTKSGEVQVQYALQNTDDPAPDLPRITSLPEWSEPYMHTFSRLEALSRMRSVNARREKLGLPPVRLVIREIKYCEWEAAPEEWE